MNQQCECSLSQQHSTSMRWTNEVKMRATNWVSLLTQCQPNRISVNWIFAWMSFIQMWCGNSALFAEAIMVETSRVFCLSNLIVYSEPRANQLMRVETFLKTKNIEQNPHSVPLNWQPRDNFSMAPKIEAKKPLEKCGEKPPKSIKVQLNFSWLENMREGEIKSWNASAIRNSINTVWTRRDYRKFQFIPSVWQCLWCLGVDSMKIEEIFCPKMGHIKNFVWKKKPIKIMGFAGRAPLVGEHCFCENATGDR